MHALLFASGFHGGVTLGSSPRRARLQLAGGRAAPARAGAWGLRAELSALDREYLAKVRARLQRGRAADAARSAPSSGASSAFSPPGGGGAGAEAFAAGMGCFHRGEYAAAVPRFRAAVLAAGPAGPRGGRLALWLAQALDAAGCRADAVAELEALAGHSDADVARTAAELLFIVTAPRLELGPDAFVSVPPLDDAFYGDGRRRLVAAGLDRRLRAKRKPPEKYSLEWYLQNKPPRAPQGEQDNSWVLLAGVAAGGAAFLLSAIPWGN